jgi:hypothetical protein
MVAEIGAGQRNDHQRALVFQKEAAMTEKQKVTALSSRSDRSAERGPSAEARWKLVAAGVLMFILLFFVVSATFGALQVRSGLGVVLTGSFTASAPELSQPIHSFPDTTFDIHVFNDQLAAWNMSEAQFEFAASHYAGAQKLFASDIRRLRSHNPNFVVLNYRLGLGLGFQGTTADCRPNGAWTEVIEGEKRLREYPENPADEWFFQWGGQRVLFCDWGWYVMDIDNPSWRNYWAGEVLRQLHANAADGVFVDSLFPPSYFGADKFDPALPAVDQTFEESWSSRIERFIAFGQSGELAAYPFIPNVGAWVTGRDTTDYSGADGVMVEGFARWHQGEYFSAEQGDWQMQLDRILRMVNLDKVVLLQQYVNEEQIADRLFLLGSYLLIKGHHTYLNFEVSSQPEWFPEYEIPIGAPVGGIPRSIGSLWRADWEVYAREYSRGLVLVNPSQGLREVSLPKTYYQVMPHGGGIVPVDGNVSSWGVDYVAVTKVALPPNQAVVLLSELPAP